MEEVSVWGVYGNIVWWLSLWALFTYFWMNWETLVILTVMLLLDWVFGVVNAYMKKTLESWKMTNGLLKKLTRRCIPFIVIWVLKGAGFENIELISNWVLSILIVSEWYSIIWHIYSINTGKQLKEIDALKLLLEWIANMFKWELEKKSELESKEESKKEDK